MGLPPCRMVSEHVGTTRWENPVLSLQVHRWGFLPGRALWQAQWFSPKTSRSVMPYLIPSCPVQCCPAWSSPIKFICHLSIDVWFYLCLWIYSICSSVCLRTCPNIHQFMSNWSVIFLFVYLSVYLFGILFCQYYPTAESIDLFYSNQIYLLNYCICQASPIHAIEPS